MTTTLTITVVSPAAGAAILGPEQARRITNDVVNQVARDLNVVGVGTTGSFTIS